MNESSKQRTHWLALSLLCGVGYVTQQWTSYHENFSFIIT